MRRIFIISLFSVICFALPMRAQTGSFNSSSSSATSSSSSSTSSKGGYTDLYISKQTGQFNRMTGSGDKKTDQYESGSVDISVSGPVKYSVYPEEMSIGPNESKTWTGAVWGDVDAGPAPGNSIPASITGKYKITYSKPDPTAPNGHSIVNKTGVEMLAFMVNSVNVDAVDSVTVCKNTDKVLYAEGYPAGKGTYAWEAGGNVTITKDANTQSPTIQCKEVGKGTAKVTYTVEGVSYSKTIQVICKKPELSLSADTIRIGIDERFNVTAKIVPGGSVKWTASEGIQLNSGPYNIVAFCTAKQGGWQELSCEANICGEKITKKVKVYVSPCMVYVPAEIYVLKNVNSTISASANKEGDFSWKTSDNITIVSGGNTQTVTVKGTEKGDGWAEVTFKNKDCNLTKKVKVIVLDKPTLSLEAGSTSICKKERRIINAKALPEGGSFQWSLSNGNLKWYTNPLSSTAVIEAVKGGTCTVSCTYTVSGQSVTSTLDYKINEYSKIEITASNDGKELDQGTKVTYTAKAYDQDGKEVSPPPPLHWKVVYIPIGQEEKQGNWYSYELQGTGASQTYTWSFPQGSYPLPPQGPYKMSAWIAASEYCTYTSGSVHIKVIKKDK